MQKQFTKQQKESLLIITHFKQDIFQDSQYLSNSFSLFQENLISKFKIPKINNEEAKSIFIDLNKKSFQKQSLSKKNWKSEESWLLVYIVNRFAFFEKTQSLSEFSDPIWEKISQFLPGRSAQACKYKVLSLTASTITNVPWSIQERDFLREIIQEQGMNWNVISQKLYERSNSKIFRTSKQCREHYMCFLKPNLKKGAWTQQQDYKLICLFQEYGRKWSKIMKFIEGRNENSIKNRFFLLFQNKGKNSSQSDLLRKIKRKKEKMEEILSPNILNFKLLSKQTADEHNIVQENWNGILQNQIRGSVIEPQTKKGQQMELCESLLKYRSYQFLSRKDLQESVDSKNNLSLCSFHSYQHLDFSQLQIRPKDPYIMDPFEPFEQYICF